VNTSGARRGGELQIIDERVLVAIPRGDEELRVTFTRALVGEGRAVEWHSLRVFWKDDQGHWRPDNSDLDTLFAEPEST
jgi:hypothetical protein